MPFVEILSGVVVHGSPRKPGDRIELTQSEARLLTGLKRARIVDTPMPVVIEPPLKPQRKARARKPESGQFEADNPSTPDVNEAWVNVDAPPAAE